jgi:hypothetical protein
MRSPGGIRRRNAGFQVAEGGVLANAVGFHGGRLVLGAW